ncbi:MAG: hypothetical protein KatS3mg104_0469 [Phycisphaerae bacterium]|nr:MAG: hypothetical protein KatS3mg104_0469 [Phycisphaerae bacterium]
MYFTSRHAALSGMVAFALAGTCVHAAPIPWTSPSGSNADISWSAGQSDNGLFGDPIVSGTTFLFFPSAFQATASGGSAQTTSDRLSFQVSAMPGKFLSSITIREVGDWSIEGGGSVKVAGALYVTKLNSPGIGSIWTDTLDVVYQDLDNSTTYNSPARPTSDGGGTWEGIYTINLPAGVTSIQVVLNNILQATSTAGGTAFIQKKVVGGPSSGDDQIEVVIPEPASLSLLFFGAAGLLGRRRFTVHRN